MPLLSAVVAILALFAAPARASAQLLLPSPIITHAAADEALESLRITGANFGETTPTVMLGDVSLVATTFSDTGILAMLPPGIARGSYGLVVIRPGWVAVHSAPFPLTLGPPPLPGLAVESVKDSVLPFLRKSVFAPCPAGKFPISGGVFTEGGMSVTDNGPGTVGGQAGWQGGVFNPQVDSSDVVVIAICVAKPSP